MTTVRLIAILAVAVAGAGVVGTRDPLRQAIAVSFYGLVLAAVFFLHQAPDVALSQIVVGAVALPLMILLTLSKVRKNEDERRRRREDGEVRG